MRLFGREFVGPAKVLVVMAAVLLISAGMCGLQLTIANKVYNSSGAFGSIMMLMGVLELIAMVVSLVGIAVVLVTLLVRRAFHIEEPHSPDETGRIFHVTSQGDERQEGTAEEPRDKDDDTTR